MKYFAFKNGSFIALPYANASFSPTSQYSIFSTYNISIFSTTQHFNHYISNSFLQAHHIHIIIHQNIQHSYDHDTSHRYILRQSPPVDQRSPQRRLIGKLQLRPHRKPRRDARYFHTQRRYQFRQIRRRRLALYRRIHRQYHLAKRPTRQPDDQLVNLQIRRRHTIERRYHPMQYVKTTMKLLRRLYRHQILRRLHHAQQRLLPHAPTATLTRRRFTQILANLAVTNRVARRHNRRSQRMRRLGRLPQ